MKNIAIFGSSRSGKSTLAKMISKKHPDYHIIAGDHIRWAFQKILPDIGINSKNGKGMSEDFPKFLSCLFYISIQENMGEMNYIVDSCDITPQRAFELFRRKDTILLFLGTPRQTAEEHLGEIRKYQTDQDWTYRKNDEQMLEHSRRWVAKSIEYEEACKNLNIWYVDTSFNRAEILNRAFEKIEEMIAG